MTASQTARRAGQQSGSLKNIHQKMREVPVCGKLSQGLKGWFVPLTVLRITELEGLLRTQNRNFTFNLQIFLDGLSWWICEQCFLA